jgi:hypothetical protein
VASVLDSMCARGKLSGYILKMRSDISRILSTLRREGAVLHNVALGVELPEDAQVDDRPRIVLTDDEVLRFRRRGFATELDMMALVARDLAGHRTSDLHAFSWEDCDRVAWRSAKVRRPKTDGQRGRDSDGRRAAERGGRKRGPRAYEKVTHGIPATVREHLIDWWVAHGSPRGGPRLPRTQGAPRRAVQGEQYLVRPALPRCALVGGHRAAPAGVSKRRSATRVGTSARCRSTPQTPAPSTSTRSGALT